jgi:methyltransferase (TIGR00027 family)
MRTNTPSSTALYIAKKLVFAADEPGYGDLVPPVTVLMSRRYVEHVDRNGAAHLRAYRRPVFRLLVRLLERMTIPGMTLHYILRKARIEKIARCCQVDGFMQIVVLGAGFDTLTQRLAGSPEFDNVALFEVDHPATQEAKREVLNLFGLLGDRVQFVACDIGADDLIEMLKRSEHFDSSARTLLIAEGLLMYLDPNEVDRFFVGCCETFGGGNRVAFTFMEPQRGGRIAFGNQSWIVDLWLKWRGEPLTWGAHKGALPGYLARKGLGLLELTDTAGFREEYLVPRGLGGLSLADGDHLCLAEVGASSHVTVTCQPSVQEAEAAAYAPDDPAEASTA